MARFPGMPPRFLSALPGVGGAGVSGVGDGELAELVGRDSLGKPVKEARLLPLGRHGSSTAVFDLMPCAFELPL